MPLRPAEETSDEEVPDPRSFLRTAPDPAHSRVFELPQPSGQDAPNGPIFPLPDLNEAVIAPLAEWDQFAALAVRMDLPAQGTVDGALQSAVSTCLEKFAKQTGGVWFAWESGLHGCACPGTNGHAALKHAHAIQSVLACSRVETVSIGISEFPLIDYNYAATLHNAVKALNHAAFFGPASIVTFDAISLNISGDHYYQNGDLDAAVTEYRAGLRLDAANVNLHNSLGICLAQQGANAEARRSFEEAHRLDPNDAMAIYNMGVLHLLEKDHAQAMTWFRQAFAVDDGIFDTPFQIGKLLVAEKAYSEALIFLQRAATLRADCASVHTLRGRCLACLGRSEEAIPAYERAIKFNPNDAAALSALGTLYDARGENPEISITFCRQSIAVSPDVGLFRLRLARLYHKHNQLENALSEYESATALGCDTRRQIAEIREQLSAVQDDGQCCGFKPGCPS